MNNIIYKYFTDLTEEQKRQIDALLPLYQDWNSKINTISRKDIDQLYLHHVLHSLSIAKVRNFSGGSKVLDVGTGGGFPGIPLAIMFPDCHFTLCDSVGKKIKVVNEVSQALGLKNITAVNDRVEKLGGKYDFVVSRAVAELGTLYGWVKGAFKKELILLKGGFVTDEIADCIQKWNLNPKKFSVVEIDSIFAENYFEEKKLIFLHN